MSLSVLSESELLLGGSAFGGADAGSVSGMFRSKFSISLSVYIESSSTALASSKVFRRSNSFSGISKV